MSESPMKNMAYWKAKNQSSPMKDNGFFTGSTKEAIEKYKGKAKNIASRVKGAIQDPVSHGKKVLKGAGVVLGKASNPTRAAYEDVKHYKKTGKAPKLSQYEQRAKNTGDLFGTIDEMHRKGVGYKVKK